MIGMSASLYYYMFVLDLLVHPVIFLCIIALAGGRGGRNARFLVGDQDDSDEGEEEEVGGNSKKGYFSDPESEESEDKSK